MTLIIVLIIIGVILLIIEIALIPGFGIAGIGALAALATSVIYAYLEYGSQIGTIVLSLVVVLGIVALVVSLRAKTWERFALHSKIESSVNDSDDLNYVQIHDKGESISRLAPMGKVRVNGQIFEATTINTYIQAHTPVEVLSISEHTLTVRPYTPETLSPSSDETPSKPTQS